MSNQQYTRGVTILGGVNNYNLKEEVGLLFYSVSIDYVHNSVNVFGFSLVLPANM